jgi:hypothetical protein
MRADPPDPPDPEPEPEPEPDPLEEANGADVTDAFPEVFGDEGEEVGDDVGGGDEGDGEE